ncbi:MAG: peptidoglycan DD-metalloendopeptidase family protein [Patescibacteria group bacterium]|nr:peptidoglycan DD-metalloendopeptidase family protein [Patescibacteria group bacterium]
MLSVALFLPHQASAFWPFSTNADAATNTIIPSSSTPALVASINMNPNSRAPIALATSGGAALVAYNGPEGTTNNVVGSERSDRISVYVVRSGDTLSEIAEMFDVSVNTIFWANNLKSARDVHPGDTLVILPVSGIERVIVKGDTLNSLAKKYNANANDIAQFNGLDPTENLVIGSTIIIPGGEIATPAPRSTSSSSIREPYLGGSGPIQTGYYSNPMPGRPITQALHGWNAVDFGAPRNTPIYAAADGTAIIARSNGAWNGGYGNYVVITHGNGSQTLYSHMTRTAVSAGQSVYSGQVIGYVGATGLSTGPHLHFEVRGAANPFRNCPVGRVCAPQ